MIRALVTFAALLLVVLAFVLDQPWLYGAAAVALVGTLGYLGRHFWIAYRQNTTTGPATNDAGPTEDSLEDLGIMDVRPQEGEGEEGAGSEQESSSSRPSAPEESSDGSSEPKDDEEWPESVLSEEERESMTGQGGISQRGHLDEHPVLGPFLESLRAAVGAQSVALLLQEEVALEYRIEAIASVQMDVQVEGTFSTQEPLLSAAMSQEPVTVHSVDDAARHDLRYYETVPAITQVALAPIVQPDSSTTVFLLVDATAEIDLGTSRVRNLLARFARTVALLLDVDAPVPGTGAATDELQEFIDAGEYVSREEADDEDGDAADVDEVDADEDGGGEGQDGGALDRRGVDEAAGGDAGEALAVVGVGALDGVEVVVREVRADLDECRAHERGEQCERE